MGPWPPRVRPRCAGHGQPGMQSAVSCGPRSDPGTPRMKYPNTQLLIDGQWCDAASARTLPVLNPATGQEIGRVAHAGIADLDRALAAAQRGFELWRDTPALERSAVMRRAAALMRERAADIGALMTQEQGKPLAEVEGRSHDVGRDHRMVRRRRPPRLRPRGAVAFAGRAADGAEEPGRAGGGLHAVELPDQPGGAQAVGGAGHRLLDDRQGARGNPGLAGGADPGLRRCRRAGRRGRPGVRQPGRDLGLPDPAPGDPQDHLHRLHAGGQAAGRAGRHAHEARHHGTGRPRAGDRGRGREHRPGHQVRRRRQVPQRRAGVHLADALPGAQQHPRRVRAASWPSTRSR